MKQFLKFGIVGIVGFLVDAIILLVLVYIFLFDISLSRILSFLMAVFVTWLLNRNFTFNKKDKYSKKKEYSYYLTIQSVGALLNYIVFIILVKNFLFFEEYLIVPLAIASIIAMFFNFFALRKKVF